MAKQPKGDFVTFTDTSKECIELLKKYAKEGLKEGGKVVTKQMKEYIRSNHAHTGNLAKSVCAWVKIDYGTGQPYMEIGYRSRTQMRKRGVKFFVNPHWFEFGVSPHTIMTRQMKNEGRSAYELEGNGRKYGFIVRHPGLGGKNFLRNTVYENIKEIVDAEKEAIAKISDMLIEKGMRIDLGGDEEIDG